MNDLIELKEENTSILPEGGENVVKVLKIIKEKGLNAKVLGHPDTPVTSLKTYLDVYGGTADRVLKCLCIVSKGRPLVVMASGEVKIDMSKLSRVSHMKELRMASPVEPASLFGRSVGGVDPLTIPEKIPLLADRSLFEKDWIVGSAGSPYAGLRIDPKEILRIRQMEIADLAESTSANKK